MTDNALASARPIRARGYNGIALALSIVLALFVPAVGEAGSPQTVQPGKSWRFRVFTEKLTAVDDLATGRDGRVYATQALDGDGRVVRLREGYVEVVVRGLEHPRGVAVRKNSLYVTEQVNEGSVIEVNLTDGKRRVFEGLHSPEHIALLPDGELAVTENGVNGRLVRLLANGTVEVITAGINNPEGLSVGSDGTIFVGESGTGRILAWKHGVLDVAIDDIDEPGQIEAAPDGALWITERANPGRLLRFKDGALETVLSGLIDPRGIALTENGAVLVAEQGRGRVLMVEPKP